MDNALNITADLALRGVIVYFTPTFLRSCAYFWVHFLSHRAYPAYAVLSVVSPIYTLGPWSIARMDYAQKSSKGFHCQKRNGLYDYRLAFPYPLNSNP